MELSNTLKKAIISCALLAAFTHCVQTVKTSKIHPNCPAIPATTFEKVGLDATAGALQFGKLVTVGELTVKTDPQIISGISQSVRDDQITDALICAAKERGELKTDEQIAHAWKVARFFARTTPTPADAIEFFKQNPFPATSGKQLSQASPIPAVSQYSGGSNSPNIVGDGNQVYLNLKPNEMSSFHVVAGHVAFNSRNPNQLIANTYIRNDAGQADIVVYASGKIAKVTADQQQVIKELHETVSGDVKQGDGLHFTVPNNEIRWFTVPSPVLSVEQVQQYKKGELAFYFVSSVVIAEQNTTKVLEHCGFVIGDRPRVIHDCPSIKKH